MVRSLFGFLKGLIVGLGMGFLLLYLNIQQGILPYIGCGLVGALVGILCGRAPWKVETFWVPLLRSLFGFIVGLGLYALGHTLLASFSLITINLLSNHPIQLSSGVFLSPIIGAIYGLFVELDDGAVNKKPKTVSKALSSHEEE